MDVPSTSSEFNLDELPIYPDGPYSKKPLRRKGCFVPQCKSTTTVNPEKWFIPVPSNLKTRKNWFKLARRPYSTEANATSQIHACQDHFDTWQEKEAGKIIVYSTTMGIVRGTYHRCLKVKQILRTHLVKFDDKDVFMSRETQQEFKERMGTEVINVPQIFVEGVHIGDADAIERLNESGELRRILKPYKSADACTICAVCGGYRLLPCNLCNGSKKSVHRNHFTTELVALKCMNCDEVGLVKCYAC